MRVISRLGSTLKLKDLAMLLSKKYCMQGIKTAEFEERFSKLIGVESAIATASARSALELILNCLGIGEGDSIILPSYTASIVPLMLTAKGISPIFLDSEENSYNMDVEDIEKNIRNDTKAVLVTYINGKSLDIHKVIGICKKHHLFMIEDCAQAAGVMTEHGMLGSFGDAAYFSFGASKHINTLGGGMITTNNNSLAKKIKKEASKFNKCSRKELAKEIIFRGILPKKNIFTYAVFPLLYLADRFKGINDIIMEWFGDNKVLDKFKINSYRRGYTDFQAIIGLRELDGLKKNQEARENNARMLDKLLEAKRFSKGLVSYEIESKNREELIRKLRKSGIDTQKTWMINCAGSSLFPKHGRICNVAEQLEKEVMYVPIYPGLSEEDISRIAEVLKGGKLR